MLPFPQPRPSDESNHVKRASSAIPETLRKVPDGFDVVSASGGGRDGQGDGNGSTETERSTTGRDHENAQVSVRGMESGELSLRKHGAEEEARGTCGWKACMSQCMAYDGGVMEREQWKNARSSDGSRNGESKRSGRASLCTATVPFKRKGSPSPSRRFPKFRTRRVEPVSMSLWPFPVSRSNIPSRRTEASAL